MFCQADRSYAQSVKAPKALPPIEKGPLRWTHKAIRFLCSQRHKDDPTLYETCVIYYNNFRKKPLTEEQEIEVRFLHSQALHASLVPEVPESKDSQSPRVTKDDAIKKSAKKPKKAPAMSFPSAIKKRSNMPETSVEALFEEDPILSMKYGKVVVHKKNPSPILPDYYGLSQTPQTHE